MLAAQGHIDPASAGAGAVLACLSSAAMNFFVRRDPYPAFPPFETDLPHLGRYRLAFLSQDVGHQYMRAKTSECDQRSPDESSSSRA